MIGTNQPAKNCKNRHQRVGAVPAKGFSLIEIMISVAIFSVIILSATNIFKIVIDSQRSALATQNVQESLKYFFEVIGKEIRMAQKNGGICPDIPNDKVFAVSTGATGDILSFKNYYGQCVTYFLGADGDSQRFRIKRGLDEDFISPRKIRIDNLRFILSDSTSTQPLVTINLLAHALDLAQFRSAMTIQTSFTSRYYK
jgi:prepilin-type N-terminal cleavage/methylation domain-containing protein